MSLNDFENFSIINKLIENSIFTTKQIEIIYNNRRIEKTPINISRGAYYRQVKQSRTKIKRLYYSIILLSILDVIKEEHMSILNAIIAKISILFDESNHKKNHSKDASDVIFVMEEMINRLIAS
ncbi:MAG: hypothetical protein M3162_02380 [Thermoproteota archaeon]|nr:hypothetical protein [Thermoproteota archaeon]